MPFQTELKKIGLTDKEAAVYQAALEAGAATVQQISRKSKVARATTYLILEALMEKGLITRYEEGGKTLFAPEPPSQLERLLDKQEEELRTHREDLGRLLPKLQAFMRSADERPIVRYFAGVEGLRAMRSEMARYSTQSDVWYSFTPLDHLRAVFGDDYRNDYTYAQSRSARGIRHKVIFTTSSATIRDQELATARKERAERRYVPPSRYRSTSGMTIFSDHIAIANFTGKVGGIITESPSAAEMMRELFLFAWDAIDSK